MTFQETFLHDSSISIMTLVAGIVMVLAGAAIILWGVWVTRQRTVPSSLRNGWQQHLTLALSDLASEHIDDDVIQSAQRQWIRSQGLQTVGFGAGSLLGVAGAFVLLQAMVHIPFDLPPNGMEMLPFIPWYWGITSGFVLSNVLGFQRHRRVQADEALTSGEPSRRVSDYRSPLLLLIVALSFLVYSIVTLILAPRYVAFSPDVIREYGIVPPPRWFLAVYPCALLLIVIFAEVCVWIVAKSSAPIRLQNSALAQRFNMGIIRQRMSGIYFMTLVFSPQFAGNGLMLFTSTGHVSESSGWRMGVWLFLFFISYAVGLPIVFTVGRMGGRLTGWPWGNGATRDGAGSAEG